MEKYLAWIKILCVPACVVVYYGGYYITYYFPKTGKVLADILPVIGFLIPLLFLIHVCRPSSRLLPKFLRR